VVTKREFSNTEKLSVFKSVVVPILTCGHESWVMTEIMLTQVQAAEMGFLRRVHGVTGAYRGQTARGTKNKFGVPMFKPKVFWE